MLHNLRCTDEVTVRELRLSGFPDKQKQVHRSSFGNDHPIDATLTRGYWTGYKDKESFNHQSDKCPKLETIIRHREIGHLPPHKPPLDNNTGYYESSTDNVFLLNYENKCLKRQLGTLESERAMSRLELQNERAEGREKDDKLKEQDLQLQDMSKELQRANDCLKSRSNNVFLFSSEIKDLKRQLASRDADFLNLQSSLESEREEFRFELQNEKTKVREKDDQLNVLEYQLQYQSEEIQRAIDCLDERTDNITSLKSYIKDLEKQVTSQKTEIYNLQNILESERIEFRFELQNQRVDQLKRNECECHLRLKSEDLQRANGCLDEDIYIQEEILNSDTTRISNTQRQSVNILAVRRDGRLLYLIDQLQQKLREVQGQQINMTRTISIQHETILHLRRDHSEFLGNRLHFEKEDEYKKTEKPFEQAMELMDQIDDEFRECISSLKNDKSEEVNLLKERLKCEEDDKEQLRKTLERKENEAKRLEERLECKEKEKRAMHDNMLKMTKEHDDQISKQSKTLKQQSKEVAFYKTVAESNTSVALNKKIQNLDRDAKIRETNVKKYEEELRSKINQLKERTIFLEGQARIKDAQLSELRDQYKKSLKSLHEQCVEERYSTLKKKSQDLEDECRRRNDKIVDLEKTLDHTSNELRDKRTHLMKTMKERDELSSKLRDMRLETPNQSIKTEADSNKSYEALKRKIQRLELEMKTKDSEVEHLRKMFDRRNVSLGAKENNEKETNNQLLEQSFQHRQALDSLQEKKAEFEGGTVTLKKTIQHLEAEVQRCNEKNRWLEKSLDRKKKEISDKNEQYVRAVKEKDEISSQVSDLRQQTKRTYDSEAESYKTIRALKAELKHLDEETKLRDAKVKHLEKMLENNNIRQGERINQLQKKIQEKEDQLSAQKYQHHQVLAISEKVSELEETITFLKKENRHLEAEIERCNKTNRGLEETLDHKKKEMSDTSERFERAEKERDGISSQVNDLQQWTNKAYHSEGELDRTISALKGEIQQLDKEMKLRDAKAKKLEKELQSKNSNLCESISKLEKQIQEKEDQLSVQSYQHQQVVTRLHKRESELEETIVLLKKKIQDFEADGQRLVSKIHDLEEQLKKTKLVAKAGLKEDVPAVEKEIADLKQELKQTRTKLRDTEAELNETKTRLSKAMGERLTDNNPNITDLGDKNRPTKLAERFAELYDNQWTDAFDIIEKKSDTEEEAIEALLHILQDAMSFCKTKEREQMEDLRRVLVFADKNVHRAEAVDMSRLFKEHRKAMASFAVENLFQAYEAHIRQSADERLRMAMEVKSYAKECLEICWFMTVQDPPVVFAPLLKKGVPFNNELFRPYTKSGSNVAFVVWPALLLHDHGPVLAKGVAQGAGKL